MIELDVNAIIENMAENIKDLSIQNAVLKTENAVLQARLKAIEEKEVPDIDAELMEVSRHGA